jgi:hypothetical protein
MYQRSKQRQIAITDSSQNGFEMDTNNAIEDSPIKDDNQSAHAAIDNSWKKRAQLNDVDLESTFKHSNRALIGETFLNINNVDTQQSNPLDQSSRSVLSHNLLQQIAELGTMAMEISTERMEAPAPHEKVVVAIIVLWFVFISCIIFIPMEIEQREFIIGIAVNVNMSFFYGAPLSIIWKVIKTRDSSWIHRHTMIMNTCCALFFLAFGIGIMNYFLIVPNGIGVVLGGVQLLLRLVVPSSDKSKESPEAILQEEISIPKRPVHRIVHIEDFDVSRTSELSA